MATNATPLATSMAGTREGGWFGVLFKGFGVSMRGFPQILPGAHHANPFPAIGVHLGRRMVEGAPSAQAIQAIQASNRRLGIYLCSVQ